MAVGKPYKITLFPKIFISKTFSFSISYNFTKLAHKLIKIHVRKGVIKNDIKKDFFDRFWFVFDN